MSFEMKKWSINYLEDLKNAMNDPKLTESLREDYPYPFLEQHARHFIEQRMLNSEIKQCCRAIVSDSKLIGSIEILIGNGVYCGNAEISIWIDKDYRRRGIATDTVKKMCGFVFDDYPVERIEAKPYIDENIFIAEKLFHNAGFKFEGKIRNAVYKNGKYYSYKVFSMLREDFNSLKDS